MRHPSLLASAALAIVLSLTTGAALAQEAEPATTITWKGAPEFKWGEFTFKPRGRVFLDYVDQDVDRATGLDFGASESRIRTARIGVQGTWTDQWSYVAEASIANGEANWEDLLLEYSLAEHTAITVGNFKSLSLENLTSSRYTTFMERGAFNDLIDVGRVMTLAARTGGDNWSIAGGVHGDSVNDPSTGGDEQRGAFLRAHLAPIVTDDMKLHLGVWARDRDRNDDAAFRYRVRNNTNFGDRYTDAGSSPLGAGESDTAVGVEAAAVWRSVSVQGEWATIDADLTGGGSAGATGYYVFASFFPTGEQRKYDAAAGEFGRVSIRNPLTKGGIGAVELAVRYDAADLTEFAGVAAAGEYSAVTLGATWYPFPYVRFMANYTDSKNEAQVAASDVDVQTLQVRAQFDF
ncbi:OprO/OprP family phosphate-selective porin [Brevundimonas sp.]|uniref:OprO/OprP family phosphate-selective porin n=1 Tax=Brevundimonas sp. TaxID=1871086 RepID=UPI002D36528E|nr:porin [Brevundimonas sp.]HYC97563.1 porin [Brevundimonas sp.]